jgi:hypothetical protein
MKALKGIAFAALLVGLVLMGRQLLLTASAPLQESNPATATGTTPAVGSSATDNASAGMDGTGTVSTESSAALEAKDLEQIRVLDEILESKNDNDPRMDRLLRDLSEPMKKELHQKYSRIQPEKRNERGTVVFLIGREIAEGRGSTADLQFFKQVLLEKPCLSLEDCSKSPTGHGPDEQHLEAIHETTIQYPQLMAIRYLKIALNQGALSPVMKEAVLAILESARQSPNERVVSEATATLGSDYGK